jgi:hypothetical protein
MARVLPGPLLGRPLLDVDDELLLPELLLFVDGELFEELDEDCPWLPDELDGRLAVWSELVLVMLVAV